MKRSPETQKLEQIMRSSPLAGGGFLGADTRPLEEIMEADAAELAGLCLSREQVARRMADITKQAEQGMGAAVTVGDHLEATATDTRGSLPCPWPHPGRYRKTVITVTRTDTGESLRWSALSVHLIEAHGFFEGRGSPFRLAPRRLASVIF
jgi:hypothetical protein